MTHDSLDGALTTTRRHDDMYEQNNMTILLIELIDNLKLLDLDSGVCILLFRNSGWALEPLVWAKTENGFECSGKGPGHESWTGEMRAQGEQPQPQYKSPKKDPK